MWRIGIHSINHELNVNDPIPHVKGGFITSLVSLSKRPYLYQSKKGPRETN